MLGESCRYLCEEPIIINAENIDIDRLKRKL